MPRRRGFRLTCSLGVVVLGLTVAAAGCSDGGEGRDLVIEDYSDQISTLNEVVSIGQRYVDGSLTGSEATEAMRSISTVGLDGDALESVTNLVIAIRADDPSMASRRIESVEQQIEVLEAVRQGFIDLEE